MSRTTARIATIALLVAPLAALGSPALAQTAPAAEPAVAAPTPASAEQRPGQAVIGTGQEQDLAGLAGEVVGPGPGGLGPLQRRVPADDAHRQGVGAVGGQQVGVKHGHVRRPFRPRRPFLTKD